MTIFSCNACDPVAKCKLDAGDEPLDFYPDKCPFDEKQTPAWQIESESEQTNE